MKRKWLAALIAAVMAAPVQSQLRPAHRFALSADYLGKAVVKALSQQGVEIDAGQVSLLAKVVASQPNPTLDVHSMGILKGRTSGNARARSTVRLTCHEAGECLPFYAIVTWAAETGAQGLSHPASVFLEAKKDTSPIVMHAGASATLYMEDSRARLQMSVISLENGPVGRTIRVQSADRKKTYSAEIVSANTLKGSF